MASSEATTDEERLIVGHGKVRTLSSFTVPDSWSARPPTDYVLFVVHHLANLPVPQTFGEIVHAANLPKLHAANVLLHLIAAGLVYEVQCVRKDPLLPGGYSRPFIAYRLAPGPLKSDLVRAAHSLPPRDADNPMPFEKMRE